MALTVPVCAELVKALPNMHKLNTIFQGLSIGVVIIFSPNRSHHQGWRLKRFFGA
jgi:hypothetical protein